MSYSTGSLTAAGHLARNSQGRNPQIARWPTGEMHAVDPDDQARALCGADIKFVFDDRPFHPGPIACLPCVIAAYPAPAP